MLWRRGAVHNIREDSAIHDHRLLRMEDCVKFLAKSDDWDSHFRKFEKVEAPLKMVKWSRRHQPRKSG